jgi:hypothetical protein
MERERGRQRERERERERDDLKHKDCGGGGSKRLVGRVSAG